MKRVGLVAGLAAFTATAVLAATRDGRSAVPAAAPVRHVTAGQTIDGISCQPTEAVLFHTHARLTVFVGRAQRQVPAGIGIGAGGSCFMWLHTHAADGIIHTESPVERVYTLGDFFDVWGAQLDRHRVGDARGPVTAFVDGYVYTGDPRRIPLHAHAQIQLDVGTPVVAPVRIAFPAGL